MDASKIKYTVEKSTIIITDKEQTIRALKASITEEVNKRADTNIQIIRETARREAERFVTRFIVKSYGVDADTPVSVVFVDETSPKIEPGKL